MCIYPYKTNLKNNYIVIQIETPKTLNRQQRYYQKNKDKFKEYVRKQRFKQKKIKSAVKLLTPINSQIQEKELSPLEPINPIDLMVWTKKMVYICVDIRDLMIKQVWNLNNQNIFIEKRKYIDTEMQTDLYSEKVRVFRPKLKEVATTSTQTLQTSCTENKEMEYINCIKQILNVNEKYVTLHVINDIKFPFFYNKRNIR